MTIEQEKEFNEVCGVDPEVDKIPTIIRNREKETLKSECCGGRMVNGGIQCEVCGSDGKLENTGPQIFSSLESGEEENEKRAKELNQKKELDEAKALDNMIEGQIDEARMEKIEKEEREKK